MSTKPSWMISYDDVTQVISDSQEFEPPVFDDEKDDNEVFVEDEGRDRFAYRFR